MWRHLHGGQRLTPLSQLSIFRRAYTNTTRVPPFSSIIATTTVSSKLTCYQHHITHSFFASALSSSLPFQRRPFFEYSDTCAPVSLFANRPDQTSLRILPATHHHHLRPLYPFHSTDHSSSNTHSCTDRISLYHHHRIELTLARLLFISTTY